MYTLRQTEEFQEWLVPAVLHAQGNVLIIMLAGGDKSTQSRDIRRAKRILKELELES